MSFEAPAFLLVLLVVPLRRARLLAPPAPRRAKFAVRYTNLEVLASVAATARRLAAPRPRRAPAGVARRARRRLRAADGRGEDGPNERASVVLVVDVSGSMRANGRQADEARGGEARDAVRSSTGRPTRCGSAWSRSPTSRRSSSRRRSTASCSRPGSTCSGPASAPRSATRSQRAVDLARTATGQRGETGEPARRRGAPCATRRGGRSRRSCSSRTARRPAAS